MISGSLSIIHISFPEILVHELLHELLRVKLTNKGSKAMTGGVSSLLY